MFRRQQTVEPTVEPQGIPIRVPIATAKDAGEHEALGRLHTARSVKTRAVEAVKIAERLMIDADEMLREARREVRRSSEH